MRAFFFALALLALSCGSPEDPDMTFRMVVIPRLANGSPGYIGAVMLFDSNGGARDANASGAGLTYPDARIKFSAYVSLNSLDAPVDHPMGDLVPITGAVATVPIELFGPEFTMATAFADRGIPLAFYKHAVGSTKLEQWINDGATTILEACLANAAARFATLGVPAAAVKLFVVGDTVAETSDEAEALRTGANMTALETEVHATFPNAVIIVLAQAPALYGNLDRGPIVRAQQEAWVAASPTTRKLVVIDSIVSAVTDNHPDAPEIKLIGTEIYTRSRGAVMYPTTGLP